MATADVQLADAIVARLNELAEGRFRAERTWVPDWDSRRELQTLQVAVQPSVTPSGELVSRSRIMETWPVDIAFAVRLQEKTRDEIDCLLQLVDEVRESLQIAEIEAGDMRFRATGFEFVARFDPEQLQREYRESQVVYVGYFLSVLRIPFVRTD